MLLSQDDAQRELQATVRRFLQETSPSAAVRQAMESEAGYDAALWKRMAQDLGLQGVAVPEACGGQGLGFAELAAIGIETGRALLCAPWFSTVVLAGAALEHAARDEPRRELQAAIAAGEVLTLASPGVAGDPAPGAPLPRARRAREGFRIDGVVPFVLDGHAAARLLVVARTDGASAPPAAAADAPLGLFCVDAGARGLRVRPLQGFDRTRRLAHVALDGVPARALGVPGEDAPGLARALLQATAALCAESLGGMEQVVAAAVDHARTRSQFGRVIGSFQAIKHKCADLQIALEAARSVVDQAVESVVRDAPQLPFDISVAASHCGEAFVHACVENVQIHGGVGFTWEHDAHLYLRRAKSSARLLGEPRWHRERIACLLEAKA